MAGSVYNGFWINWEDDQFKGATLTLPTYYGLVLVSFLTLYVQFSGGCFWRVLCFILHQFRSTTVSRDGLFHQQQAILRNAITAPNAMWSLSRSAVAWRGKVNSPILNSIPLLLITFVHIAFFAVAGLFSSQVTNTAHGQALVRSDTCGFPVELSNPRNTESADLTTEELMVFNTEVLLGRLTLTKSAAYVRSCYNDDTNSGTAACNIYVQPHLVGINASAVNNASCPFGNDACTAPAVRYDSGYIHSGEDLGINCPDRDSLSFRRVTTCAPIKGEEKYSTPWRDNVPEGYAGLSNTSIKYYEFGKGDNRCEATTTNFTTNTTTFCVTQYMKDNFQDAYSVGANTAYHNNASASDFSPIADFAIPNADTTLMSIFSKARYAGEVTDQLFLAQNVSTESSQFYTSTKNLNILGCTEQYQFCNLRTNQCTDLTGLYGIREAVQNNNTLNLSPRQNAVYTVMWKAAWAMGMQWATTILDNNILLAKDWVFTVKSTTSSALPPYQWELESYNLHNLSLAVFQRRINEFASPENFEIRPGLNSQSQVITPTDPDMLALCQLQKVRSGDHYSVSVLGMCIILIVGGLLILLDWILVQQIFWFRSFTHHRLAKKADWTSTGTMQLFRQALEAKGVAGWNTKDYEFPVLMTRKQTFTGLGAQSDPTIPLGHVNEGQGHWYGQGMGQSTAHDGGKYEAVPSQGSDVHVSSDDKIKGESGR